METSTRSPSLKRLGTAIPSILGFPRGSEVKKKKKIPLAKPYPGEEHDMTARSSILA